MFGGWVVVPKNCIMTVTLSWYVPPIGQVPYTLLVQRQAGTLPELDLTILPTPGDCTALKTAGLHFDGIMGQDMSFTPAGLNIITDNLSSHNSLETRTWLEGHPRIHHVFIPTGACWLNLQEGWWRLFRRDALAGQSFANPDEIEQATCVATAQLNRRANPWIWGRPAKDHRHYRRLFSYRL